VGRVKAERGKLIVGYQYFTGWWWGGSWKVYMYSFLSNPLISDMRRRLMQIIIVFPFLFGLLAFAISWCSVVLFDSTWWLLFFVLCSFTLPFFNFFLLVCFCAWWLTRSPWLKGLLGLLKQTITTQAGLTFYWKLLCQFYAFKFCKRYLVCLETEEDCLRGSLLLGW